MTTIGNLMEKMAEMDIQRTIIIGDEPFRFFGVNGATKGPIVPKEWLEVSLPEITPAY